MQEGKSEIHNLFDKKTQMMREKTVKTVAQLGSGPGNYFRVGTGGAGTEIGLNLMDLKALGKVLLLQIENSEGN